MKKIEQIEELNDFIHCNQNDKDSECILRVYDNKSDILLQSIVVKHPVMFIRGIQDFCKSVSLPVSDLSVYFIGFISPDSSLCEVPEIFEISPYVYFRKSEDTEDTEVSKED